MKYLLLLLLIPFKTIAQDNNVKIYTGKAKELMEIAKKLYRLERSSWMGTDKLMEETRDVIRENSGGYFSYVENDTSYCVFFTKDTVPQIYVEFSFDSLLVPLHTNFRVRPMKAIEKDYHKIRTIAYELSLTDTFFRHYENAGFNIIPLVDNGKKLAYILTAPKVAGAIIFGNDYKLLFNEDYTLQTKKRLHHQPFLLKLDDTTHIRQFVNPGDKPSFENLSSIHSHYEGESEFITETDLCTIMLYGKNDIWSRHSVISKNFASDFDIIKNKLVIIKFR